jgi:hypothetical protein
MKMFKLGELVRVVTEKDPFEGMPGSVIHVYPLEKISYYFNGERENHQWYKVRFFFADLSQKEECFIEKNLEKVP